ncbi:cytochrome P450, partial [Streptomyces sp. URMC 126]
EVVGQEIAAGDVVVVALNSANRDERRFPDPDTFDVDRPKDGHVAFGHGIHFCLGAQLARMEVDIALSALTTRFALPELRGERDELLW